MSIFQMAVAGILLFIAFIVLIVWLVIKVYYDRAIVLDDEPELENAFRKIIDYDRDEKDRFLNAIELGEFENGHYPNQHT